MTAEDDRVGDGLPILFGVAMALFGSFLLYEKPTTYGGVGPFVASWFFFYIERRERLRDRLDKFRRRLAGLSSL